MAPLSLPSRLPLALPLLPLRLVSPRPLRVPRLRLLAMVQRLFALPLRFGLWICFWTALGGRRRFGSAASTRAVSPQSPRLSAGLDDPDDLGEICMSLEEPIVEPLPSMLDEEHSAQAADELALITRT